jgi:hypothetical protein
MSVRTISARYAGKCGDCAQPVAVGEMILYGGRGKVAHANGTCSLDNVAAGPTTRERKEARAERLRGWADGRQAKSEAAHAKVDAIAGMIPFGQPILVGHHSERRARRDQDRIHNGMRAGIEHGHKADSMRSRADNIEAAADRSIYSDDPDAIERLAERVAELEAKRARMKVRNAEYRKTHRAELKELTAYGRDQVVPHSGWELTNLSGNIARNRKRLEALKREEA